MRKTNETYNIDISSPLVRPGLKVSTQVSKEYLVSTMCDLMDMVREFNQIQEDKGKKE